MLLATEYVIKNLDFPFSFTGIKIFFREDENLSLSQTHYLYTLLDRFGHDNIKLKYTPITLDAVIKKYKRKTTEAYKIIYISIVGGIG